MEQTRNGTIYYVEYNGMRYQFRYFSSENMKTMDVFNNSVQKKANWKYRLK